MTIAGVAPFTGTNIPSIQTPVTTTSVSSSDTELPSFQFIAGWMLLILALYGISRTRLGYAAIYYSLILIILLILVTEYSVLAPLLNSVQTTGQFNASQH